MYKIQNNAVGSNTLLLRQLVYYYTDMVWYGVLTKSLRFYYKFTMSLNNHKRYIITNTKWDEWLDLSHHTCDVNLSW